VVNGNDVYASCSHGQPGYWLNGNWVYLTPLDVGAYSQVNCLAVSGSNFSVGGYSTNSSGSTIPGYWLNGSFVSLAVPAGAESPSVSCLVLEGSNIYAGGNYSEITGNVLGYWLNGNFVILNAPLIQGSISSIVVSGTDVYATDFNAGPGYWLNGSWVGLRMPTGYSTGGVSSIVVQ
jgi:hypothetical protein